MRNLEARINQAAQIIDFKSERERRTIRQPSIGQSIVEERKRQIIEFVDAIEVKFLIAQAGITNFIDMILGPREEPFPENIIEVDFKRKRKLA